MYITSWMSSLLFAQRNCVSVWLFTVKTLLPWNVSLISILHWGKPSMNLRLFTANDWFYQCSSLLWLLSSLNVNLRFVFHPAAKLYAKYALLYAFKEFKVGKKEKKEKWRWGRQMFVTSSNPWNWLTSPFGQFSNSFFLLLTWTFPRDARGLSFQVPKMYKSFFAIHW